MDGDKVGGAAPGVGRCPGVSWHDLLETETRPVPAALVDDGYRYLGSEPLPTARYTSPEIARLEAEKLWPNVWQFAAREEDLPEPGDHIVYENAGRSYLVKRQADGSIRAFHNVCLHRGRKLQTKDGWTSNLTCPFHGFSWNNDGTMRQIPCQWDFSHLNPAELSLPEAEVGRWGGYIFLRENPGGPSLEEFLAPLPDHFKQWRHEDCTTVIWVAKVVPANWKVTMEAFMESWHSLVTHPQLLPFTGDANAAYYDWGDNVNANLVPFGIMSPHIMPSEKPQQWIVDEFIKYNGRSADNYEEAAGAFAVKVPEGVSARKALADSLRDSYTKNFGTDHSAATDSEVLDALVYNVFPNFAPWGGFMPNIVYRWLPWKDVDHSLMEVRILSRVPPGQKHPKGVPMKFLTDDQPWSAAPELGVLGHVFDQDMDNLPFIQQGLHASKTGKIQLSNYQEVRIRHFQQTIDKYLAG